MLGCNCKKSLGFSYSRLSVLVFTRGFRLGEEEVWHCSVPHSVGVVSSVTVGGVSRTPLLPIWGIFLGGFPGRGEIGK